MRLLQLRPSEFCYLVASFGRSSYNLERWQHPTDRVTSRPARLRDRGFYLSSPPPWAIRNVQRFCTPDKHTPEGTVLPKFCSIKLASGQIVRVRLAAQPDNWLRASPPAADFAPSCRSTHPTMITSARPSTPTTTSLDEQPLPSASLWGLTPLQPVANLPPSGLILHLNPLRLLTGLIEQLVFTLVGRDTLGRIVNVTALRSNTAHTIANAIHVKKEGKEVPYIMFPCFVIYSYPTVLQYQRRSSTIHIPAVQKQTNHSKVKIFLYCSASPFFTPRAGVQLFFETEPASGREATHIQGEARARSQAESQLAIKLRGFQFDLRRLSAELAVRKLVGAGTSNLADTFLLLWCLKSCQSARHWDVRALTVDYLQAPESQLDSQSTKSESLLQPQLASNALSKIFSAADAAAVGDGITECSPEGPSSSRSQKSLGVASDNNSVKLRHELLSEETLIISDTHTHQRLGHKSRQLCCSVRIPARVDNVKETHDRTRYALHVCTIKNTHIADHWLLHVLAETLLPTLRLSSMAGHYSQQLLPIPCDILWQFSHGEQLL
ncbi:hypothetical protein PR048_011620 [Dryococelus australis]|uniref:Uncharacterized protein n=1 Tax=Dryococelus australis TaxID=614101 RepID=A0ABQ9HM42_9NEOP|nr:hypothetical protein PR048_011620 [Dryococelus australis]